MTSWMEEGGSMKIRFPDRCLKFGSSDTLDYVTTPNSQHVYIPSGSKLSLSCWYKHNNQRYSVPGWSNIIGKHGSYNWGIGMSNTPQEAFFHGNTPDSGIIGWNADGADVISGQWIHLCGVYNGGDRKGGNKYGSMYINGSLIATGLIPLGIAEESVSAPNIKFTIGSDGSNQGGGISGCIYDVRVWSGAALTADEVELVYKGFDDVQKDKLVLWYKCNDRKGNHLDDSSGHGLNGAITGATWDDVEMTCWATRWDEVDYLCTVESFMNAGQRNLLFNSLSPGIVRELKSILGKPWFWDGSFRNANTVFLIPQSGYGLSGVRKMREITCKNLSDSFINPDYFSIKLEGYRVKNDTDLDMN